MNDIKKPLIEKIAALEIKISKYTCTVEQAQIDFDKNNVIFEKACNPDFKITDEEREFLTADNNSRLIGDINELKSYKETLAADLVHIITDYAIVSKALTSPAGFHPNERIFLQPQICIQTNNPKLKPPSCNVKLYLTDLRSI